METNNLSAFLFIKFDLPKMDIMSRKKKKMFFPYLFSYRNQPYIYFGAYHCMVLFPKPALDRDVDSLSPERSLL